MEWLRQISTECVRHLAKTAVSGLSIIGLMALLLGYLLWTDNSFRAAFFFWQPVQQVFSEQVQAVGVAGARNNGADWLSPPMAMVQLDDAKPSLGAIEQTMAETLPLTREQRRVAEYLSSRYRIAGQAAESLVRSAVLVGREFRLDPWLILAVAGIESGFNPWAESAVGAKGLMQVMVDLHTDRFTQVSPVQRSALHPVASMQVGASILRDYLKRTGSLEKALRHYVGLAGSDAPSQYPVKVLAERQRLRLAAAGTVNVDAQSLKISQTLDQAPPPRPYVSSVVRPESTTVPYSASPASMIVFNAHEH